jgi:hypothetical protein
MIFPNYRRAVLLSLVAVAAAGMAAPRSVMGCDSTSQQTCCCCQANNDQPMSAACCAASANYCECCQPAVPQNLPPERTVASIHPDFALAPQSAASSILSRSEVVATAAAPAANWIAIPHRILHCTWLI